MNLVCLLWSLSKDFITLSLMSLERPVPSLFGPFEGLLKQILGFTRISRICGTQLTAFCVGKCVFYGTRLMFAVLVCVCVCVGQSHILHKSMANGQGGECCLVVHSLMSIYIWTAKGDAFAFHGAPNSLGPTTLSANNHQTQTLTQQEIYVFVLPPNVFFLGWLCK